MSRWDRDVGASSLVGWMSLHFWGWYGRKRISGLRSATSWASFYAHKDGLRSHWDVRFVDRSRTAESS